MTGDFYDAEGRPRYRDLGLDVFEGQSSVACRAMPEHQAEIAPEQLRGANGVIVLTPRVTARSVSASEDLVTVGRFGVGYDGVDVPACTAADVAVFITAGAVDRSVAEATIAWMLALTHHLLVKDRLLRSGNWDARSRYMGSELRDRTLGVVGLGGIGCHLVQLLAGFGMRQPIAFDPFADKAAAEKLGVELVPLDDLLRRADFVSIHCPLNEKTRNLIDRRELALMKPEAYLINTARGGIVNEDALFDALREHRIAGAALDCFEVEPVTSPHRFGDFENVILAPHAVAWTNELFRDIGRTVCQGMLDFAHGRRPRGVVNPEVFERPKFKEKWERLRAV